MWEFQGAMLTAEELVRRRTKNEVVLPTKCSKSFSPTGSWLESKQLQNLLDATKTLISEERVERENALAHAEWDENLKVARVTRVVGKQFEKFGHEENMTIFLYPEEALYLLETNHLQLLYGGVSMSIQQAYTVLIGPKTGCTFAEYMVFSHLLKNGFKVLRHSAKRTVTRYERLIGLQQDKQKNRKSKRKCSIPEKEIGEGSGKKGAKAEEKTGTKSVKCGVLESSNTKTQKVADVKNDKSVAIDGNLNVNLENTTSTGQMFCVETTMDSHSSSQSDIEILSEKSACKTEESLDYDITEYSSYASEDSDCQVIYSTGAEVLNVDSKKSYQGNNVIEEINLSDSDESNVYKDNIEDNSHIKIEYSCVDTLCNDIELKDCKTSQEEQSSSQAGMETCGSFVKKNSIPMESSILENNEENHDHLIDPNGSDILTKNECVTEELLIEQVPEENTDSAIHISVREFLPNENCNTTLCVNEIGYVKEEILCADINSASPILPVDVTNQGVGASIVKKESNDNTHRAQKEQDEIEIIELDDEVSENGVIEDKNTILKSFPNSAGCNVVHCSVPPQRLCPPNVFPVHLSYSIVLDRLQDPRYGGNPMTRKNVHNARYRSSVTRHQNVGRVKRFLNRYRSRPNRQFNRRFMNSPRHVPRQDQCHNYRDVHRDQSFPGQIRFLEQTPMYPPFQPTCALQREQNPYPHFSGQPSHVLPFYQHQAGLRPRGHHNQEMYNQNSFRGYSFRNSYACRFPRRKGRGSRTAYHDRSVATYETDDNVVLDEREGNYIPCNSSDTAEGHSSCEQERRAEDHGLNQKTFRRPCENSNSAGPGRKRSRGEGSKYHSSSGRSQELMEFMQLIQNDTDSTMLEALAERRYFGACRNLITNHSTDNSSSSGSCSSSTSDESMSESTDNEGENDTTSVLLKSVVEDIDTALKSLEIVHTLKFVKITAESDEPLLSIKFDLYQPSTPFRRSNPPVPDFRVIVMQPDQYLPTSRQLAFLGEGFEDNVPLLFAIASLDSVAFYLQSVVNLPHVSSKEKVQM